MKINENENVTRKCTRRFMKFYAIESPLVIEFPGYRIENLYFKGISYRSYKIIVKFSYLCNRGQDAALRRLVPIQKCGGDQADETHGHGGGRHAEADVHAGVCLDIN